MAQEKAKQKAEAQRLAQAEAEATLLAQQNLAEEKAKQRAEEKRQAEAIEKAKLLETQQLADKKAMQQKEVQREAQEEANAAALLAEQKQIDKQPITITKKLDTNNESTNNNKPVIQSLSKDTKTQTPKTYSVQLLSLTKFTEEKLAYYCKKHKLNRNELVIRKVNGLTKISYGKATSSKAASKIQQILNQQHQISESFVVVLP